MEVPEHIQMLAVIFNGRTYTRKIGSRNLFRRNYFTCGQHSLHRDVWEFHNGPIPKGMHVHHKTRELHTVDPEKLELLSNREHQIVEWASAKPKKLNCHHCGKVFKSIGKRSKFCHPNCRAADRRKRKLDFVEKDCVICGKRFSSNRHKGTRTCGEKMCANLLAHSTSNGRMGSYGITKRTAAH